MKPVISLFFSVKTIQVPEDQPEIDIFRKTLFTFRHLGRNKIVKCITNVYPNVRTSEHLIDLNYKINFLEFYEILLLCTVEKIEDAKKLEELKKLDQKKSLGVTENISINYSKNIRRDTSKKKKIRSFGI